MSYTRFAIYYLPPEGDFARFGARWLGWDVAAGLAVAQLDLPGLDDITAAPRKYGLHGTLKPPFRLVDSQRPTALAQAVADLAKGLAPAQCAGLTLRRIDGFLALVPSGETDALARVASACVRALDGFRAPPSEAELARRRQAGLSPVQETLLQAWGYPYVLEEFRFHLTLSGRLDSTAQATWHKIAAAHLPPLPAPFRLDQIALCGERADGRFERIQRYTLAG